jgi:folate-dependent phosphoribosylglycinamide formyltransferase PurN
MKWVAFFSQTGTEIVEVCNQLQRWPDRLCTNKSIKDIESINKELLERCFDKIFFLPNKPKKEEYTTSLRTITSADVITLHGYLRILPAHICKMYKIYNGHPGDIVNYPELKGFNPQEKAFNLKIKNSGSVIHSVTAEVDGGPVIKSKQCKINLRSLEETYKILHKNSTKLWVEFLKETFKIKV